MFLERIIAIALKDHKATVRMEAEQSLTYVLLMMYIDGLTDTEKRVSQHGRAL